MTELRYSLAGAFPSPKDDRDYKFASLLTPDQQAALLPDRYLVPIKPPMLVQEGGTCTAASTTVMRREQERKEHGVWVPLDYLDLYRQQKRIDGIRGEGSTVRAAMQVLRARGQALTTPGSNPANQKIAAYYSIRTTPGDIKRAIFSKASSVVLAGPWADNWMKTDQTGVLSDPHEEIGGHAFRAIGWDDKRRAVTCTQTWPLPWGYQGRGIFFLPYDFIEDSTWGLWEAWRSTDAVG